MPKMRVELEARYSVLSHLPTKISQAGIIEKDGCWMGKRSLIVTYQMWL